MNIYLTAPLFSQFQRQYNRALGAKLEKAIPRSRVILPQDFRAEGAKYNDRRHLRKLYERCIEGIEAADVVVALLDGADADSGVAFEVGYARALGKPVLGVRTDYRQLLEKGLNLMLAQGCADILCHFSFNEKLDDLAALIVQKIEKIAPPPRPA